MRLLKEWWIEVAGKLSETLSDGEMQKLGIELGNIQHQERERRESAERALRDIEKMSPQKKITRVELFKVPREHFKKYEDKNGRDN